VSSAQVNNGERAVADPSIRFRHVDRPRVSVIITGWRSAPCLVDCLRSLAAQEHSVPYEVIVSLNEPTSTLVHALERDVEGVQVLSRPVNVGFGGACNRGAAAARGDLLLLLNDDAIVLEGWMETLVEAADQHAQAGAVGSRILHEDGTVQEEGAVIWADGSTTLLGYGRPVGPSPDLRLRRVDYCSGASLLVKRDTWEASGGMDEGYFPAYCEDVDLSLKIAAGGQEILLQPCSTVVHRTGSSTTLPYRTFLADRNRLRMAARWSPGLALFEPPEPENPDAVARAARLGESRPLPIPAPLPLHDAGEEARAGGTNDDDYLRLQVETLDAYITWLEATRAREQQDTEALMTHIAEIGTELDRMHHAAAALQENERHLQENERSLQEQLALLRGDVEEARGELRLLKNRLRYQVIDRVYDITTSIPGVPRALRAVAARQDSPPTSPAPE
jgi:GT2 family glycosyltransferase